MIWPFNSVLSWASRVLFGETKAPIDRDSILRSCLEDISEHDRQVMIDIMLSCASTPEDAIVVLGVIEDSLPGILGPDESKEEIRGRAVGTVMVRNLKEALERSDEETIKALTKDNDVIILD